MHSHALLNATSHIHTYTNHINTKQNKYITNGNHLRKLQSDAVKIKKLTHFKAHKSLYVVSVF